MQHEPSSRTNRLRTDLRNRLRNRLTAVPLRHVRRSAVLIAVACVALAGTSATIVQAVGPTLPPKPAAGAPTTKAKASSTPSKTTIKQASKAPAKAAPKKTSKSATKAKPVASTKGSFTLVAVPARRSIAPGEDTVTQVNLRPTGGFAGVVSITASGVPKGVKLSFPPRIREFAPVTITTSDAAVEDSYKITFTGVSGSKKSSTTFTLTLDESYRSSDQSDEEVVDTLPPVGGTGASTTTVSGSSTPSASSTTVASTTSTTQAGLVRSLNSSIPDPNASTTTVSGSVTTLANGDYSLVVNPGRVLLPVGGTTTFSVAIGGTVPANIVVAVSGLPAGVVSSTSTPSAGVVRVVLSAPAGQAASTSTFTVTGSADGKVRSANGELTIVTDMAVALTPSSLTIAQGASAQSTISVSNTAAFTSLVDLGITGLPTGVAPSVASQKLNNSSTTLTLTVPATTPTGSYPFTITATGGGVTRSSGGTLTVTGPGSVTATTLPGTPGTVTTLAGSSTTLGPVVAGELTLSVTPVTTSISANGGVARYNISVAGSALGTTGAVISVAGLPTNASLSVTPNPSLGASTLTISSVLPATLGSFTITVTATAGSVTKSQTVTLTLT
jgi:hypothetical protein